MVHRNGEKWCSTWASDAVWDLGGGRLVEGLESIKELWYGAMAAAPAAIQNVLNGEVQVDASGNTATGRWYIHEYVVRSKWGSATPSCPLR